MGDQSDHPAPAPAASQSQEGALNNVLILELGSLIAGPFATRLLGDLGAEVIKVEAPGSPDPLRVWGHHKYRDRTLWWPVQARGKRCITLNLNDPRGQELLRMLVRRADVLVENFRPGTLERWNLGPDRLREANAALVVARISGYGQTGRYRDRAGFASVAEAMGGLRYINGFPDRAPPRFGISLGDSLASLFAVQGILAALYHRDAAGGRRGQDVDVSLVDACFALLESAVPEFDRLGVVREPSGTGLVRIVPSNVFQSREGDWVVIAANTDGVFARLAGVMGRPYLSDDERFATHDARAENQVELEAVIADWARAQPASELDERLNAAGVPCARIYSVADIFSDPYFEERGLLVRMDDPEIGPFAAPGIVPKLSDTPGRVGWAGRSAPGADNAAVLGELCALSDDELEVLAGDGVI
jgi:formyl-CoA transferase